MEFAAEVKSEADTGETTGYTEREYRKMCVCVWGGGTRV